MRDVAVGVTGILGSHGRGSDDARPATAARLCQERGVLFTPFRRRVYELLCGQGRALTAYQLSAHYEAAHDRPIAAAPIYRALAFLLEQRFVGRLESTNAYLAYTHPAGNPPGVFFICQSCGFVEEASDEVTEARLEQSAARRGFHVRRRIIEVEGICTRCSPGHRLPNHRR